MLIDTHAHLASSKFEGEVDTIVQNAREMGVERIITISCDLDDSPTNIQITEKYDGVFAAVGIHPCYVDEVGDVDFVSELRILAAHPKVVAIGEIGLDYFHAPPEGYTVETWRAKQAGVFKAQLDLAVELNLPVVIHQRESNADTMEVLEAYRGTELRAVLHCFTGTLEQAQRAFDLGHIVSFTGIVTYPKAPEVQELAAGVPDGKFMVETDAPYLSPVPKRGKRCEPGYTQYTAEQIANLRGVSLEAVEEMTTSLAKTFFKLPS